MDDVKINISNHIFTKIISKALSKCIFKGTGVNADINLDDINLQKINGRIYVGIHAGIDEQCLLDLIKKL